jgi:lysophospholipase L1-like esterase
LRIALVFLSGGLALVFGELIARRLYDRDPRTAEELAARLERSRESPARSGAWSGVGGIVESGPTPDLPYQLRPNLSGTFRGQSFATNAWGLRGAALERVKPAGTFRIVGLGDSHMFGWGVPQNAVYLARLARLLAAAAPPGRRFEVINCAAPGYNTVLEVELYAVKCAGFMPDLVILHVVGNDFDWPHFLRRDRGEPRGSVLLALLRAALGGRQEGSDEEPDELFRGHDEPADPLRRAAVRRYRGRLGEAGAVRSLTRLAELTRSSDTAVLVVSLGDRGPVRERMLPEARRLGFGVLDVRATFARTLAERGLPNDKAAWSAAFQIAGDGHPTELAHEVYARALLAALAERGLLEGGATAASATIAAVSAAKESEP